jgi:hypothetical protein
MKAEEIYKLALAELDRLILEMTSPEWVVNIRKQPAAQQAEADGTLLLIQSQRLRLGNARLAEIDAGLLANGLELEKGRQSLSKARQGFKDVGLYLEATTAFARVLGQVLQMMGRGAA